jgi:hypothetical protein
MRVSHLSVAIALALGGCGASEPGPSAHQSDLGFIAGDLGGLFAGCQDSITPAPAGMPLHVFSGGLLSPCAYGVQLPWLGVTAKAGDSFAIATDANLVIHVQGDDGFSKDIDTTKAIDPSGYRLVTVGPIHVSVNVPQAVIEYPQPPNGDLRYAITDGQVPVTFTSP